MSTNTLPIRLPAGASRILGLAEVVARRFVELVRAWRHHKDIAALGALDDRMLKDIGLTRGDVRDAAAALPWHDPTAILVMRSNERRTTRLRVVSGGSKQVSAPSIAPEIDAWSASQFPSRSRYY